MIAFWTGLLDRFPIVSIEDALAEDDWAGWAALTARARRPGAARRATTSSSRTPSGSSAASARRAANAILVKVNQIGTLTETLDAIELAQRSRRSAS